MEFGCVEECSQCCVEREYYPSRQFGKIGVLLLPGEEGRMRRLARDAGIGVEILPRIGTSDGPGGPRRILAYQMMGAEPNGNTCPFLAAEGQSPHGGRPCTIYGQRPLACRAYPLVGTRPQELDPKCRFCSECGTADGGLESEAEALLRIQGAMSGAGGILWRYATGVCEPGDEGVDGRGWVLEGPL